MKRLWLLLLGIFIAIGVLTYLISKERGTEEMSYGPEIEKGDDW